jgi:hypothetical protein
MMRKWFGETCIAASIVLLLQGCGKQDTTAKYTPSQVDAEAAVETAMNAWKSGVPAGPVPDTSPLIHLADSYRKPDETLKEFEILGEVPGDLQRCYAVNLVFDPPREEKARFVVVGIDPLWVFRMEDYQLLTHWDHYMPPPVPEGNAGPADEESE